MPLLPLGPSCPLQTILLSDLVWYDSPLQIEMVVWRAFFKFKASQLAMIVCYRLPHPTQHVQTYHGVFSRAEKSSQDITQGLFLMNMKGLTNLLSLYDRAAPFY